MLNRGVAKGDLFFNTEGESFEVSDNLLTARKWKPGRGGLIDEKWIFR